MILGPLISLQDENFEHVQHEVAFNCQVVSILLLLLVFVEANGPLILTENKTVT